MPTSFGNVNALRLVGGMAVLDFLNTCNGRRPETTLSTVTESLCSLEDALIWSHRASVISQSELLAAQQFVKFEKSACEAALRRLLEFREILYSLFHGLTHHAMIDESLLLTLNEILRRCLPMRILVPVGFSAEWTWLIGTNLDQFIDSLIGRLATEAASLLTSTKLEKLKCCSSLECDWHFIDTSKNGQRRWCQMNVCGSKEKASRRRQGDTS